MKSNMVKLSTLKSLLIVWMTLIGPLQNVEGKSSVTTGGPDPKSILDQANAAYSKGRFKEALTGYRDLLGRGYESADLYYNLGNAHYRLEEIPEAILNYEKAYKLSPGDEDIQVNLRFANQKIQDKVEAVPAFFLSEWWTSLMMAFSLQTWSVLTIILCMLGFLLLIIYLFASGGLYQRSAFYSGLVLLSVALLTLLIAVKQHGYLNDSQQGIIFSGTVHAKSAPGAGQKTIFVVHEGLKVTLGAQENDWVQITLPNGNVGWIELASVQGI